MVLVAVIAISFIILAAASAKTSHASSIKIQFVTSAIQLPGAGQLYSLADALSS